MNKRQNDPTPDIDKPVSGALMLQAVCNSVRAQALSDEDAKDFYDIFTENQRKTGRTALVRTGLFLLLLLPVAVGSIWPHSAVGHFLNRMPDLLAMTFSVAVMVALLCMLFAFVSPLLYWSARRDIRKYYPHIIP